MDHTITLKKILALSALAYAVQAQNYLPYLDAECTKPVINFTINGNVEDVKSSFSLEGFPSASRFSNPGFGGAEAQNGGYDVWWKTSSVDTGCGQALMQAYSQGTYDRLAFTAPAGNVIMLSNGEGCIYSYIRNGVELEGSFCCGTGDCGALSVGDASLAKRDTESTTSSWLQSSNPVARSESAAGHAAAAGSIASTRKLARRGDFDASGCTQTVSGSGYPSAGQQVLVANPQECSGGTCSFQISHGITVSTSFSTSTDTTITNTVGGSISVQAGVDFIVEADVTATLEYSWAKAVSQSTGTTITNGTTYTVTNNLGQQPGTNAFVTFTPTYLCWGVTIDCGTEDKGFFDYCQPALPSAGAEPEGDYTVVYTN